MEQELLQTLVEKVDRIEKKLGGQAPPQEWFSIKQAAAVVGLSPDHVRRAVVGATLPCSNVGSNDRPLYRISRKDLDAWMSQRKAGALPPPKKGKAALPHSSHFRLSRLQSMGAAPPGEST